MQKSSTAARIIAVILMVASGLLALYSLFWAAMEPNPGLRWFLILVTGCAGLYAFIDSMEQEESKGKPAIVAMVAGFISLGTGIVVEVFDHYAEKIHERTAAGAEKSSDAMHSIEKNLK